MSVGVIIFILGLVYSIGQSIYENSKKRAQQPTRTAQTIEPQQKVSQAVRQVEQSVPTASNTARKRAVQQEKVAVDNKARQIKRVMEDQHLSAQQKMHRVNELKRGDLTETEDNHIQFDQHALVQAVIMSEILAPPKSKR